MIYLHVILNHGTKNFLQAVSIRECKWVVHKLFLKALLCTKMNVLGIFINIKANLSMSPKSKAKY